MIASGQRMGGGIGRRIAQIVEGHIKDEAPQGCTGKLKAGIRARMPRFSSLETRVEVTSEQYYTDWVINGRGWVYPVHAKVLHWKTCSGEDVFSMYARPTKPNPFHERGWQNAVPEVEANWRTFGEQIATALAD
jgi:hypothetical protein